MILLTLKCEGVFEIFLFLLFSWDITFLLRISLAKCTEIGSYIFSVGWRTKSQERTWTLPNFVQVEISDKINSSWLRRTQAGVHLSAKKDGIGLLLGWRVLRGSSVISFKVFSLLVYLKIEGLIGTQPVSDWACLG